MSIVLPSGRVTKKSTIATAPEATLLNTLASRRKENFRAQILAADGHLLIHAFTRGQEVLLLAPLLALPLAPLLALAPLQPALRLRAASRRRLPLIA